MTRTRYRFFDTAYPHFLTCTIVGWLPVFTRKDAVQIVFDSWKWLQRERGLLILGYVILENHLHLVASSPNVSEDIGDFKSYTARKIIDLLEECRATTLLRQLRIEKARHKTDRTYQVWQEGSHPQMIETEDVLRQKLDYMHRNPKERGYVDKETHWRYSSAKNYARMPGLIDVVTDW